MFNGEKIKAGQDENKMCFSVLVQEQTSDC